MKKGLWLTALAVTAAGLSLCAQTVPAIICGRAAESSAEGLQLMETVNGKMVAYATTRFDSEKRFAFALPQPKEGFYYLVAMSKGKAGRDFIRVYLKPGEQIELNITDKKYHAALVKGGAENKALYQWQEIAYTLEGGFRFWGDTVTYHSYFPALEAALPKAEAFKKSLHTGNNRFDALLKMAVDADIEFASFSLLYTPRPVHAPKDYPMPAYYNTVTKDGRYTSSDVLQLGNGIELLSRYVTAYSMKAFYNEGSKPERAELLAKQIALLGNDTVKGAYLAATFDRYKTYEDLQTSMKPYQQYLQLPAFQQAYFEALKAVSTFKAGTVGYNFSYPDMSGKKVSLKDMAGKVVLVDMWATWCGPCKAEIPHLQKLEGEMHGKDVVFVSISVDEAKDKEKWKRFVEEKKLGGVQLFAAGWSDMAKFYGVNGIPRFMVFDKKGNIVSVDAPRPSTPELKQMLEKALLN
ncbi:thiol-disulfide isomerase/thioredoxin [Filimonas zeae]|uniref:Thioredoxin domain-containing protein n=1 Tax=Filimonas zeae TaxID=1737353 RepID=A0A917IK05_9BACT|nr:TlpA disulfide reductase family protein [Filimonas zeae]MDR6337059.1 thiol-disulfide isomerase/thioredoxin [Filimonas zeae]GGH56803.1 hypothetical protein GCM10011379_00800 [Filimonas zeae]